MEAKLVEWQQLQRETFQSDLWLDLSIGVDLHLRSYDEESDDDLCKNSCSTLDLGLDEHDHNFEGEVLHVLSLLPKQLQSKL